MHCDPLPVVFSWQPSPGEQEGGKFHYEVQLRKASEYLQVSPVWSVDLVWSTQMMSCDIMPLIEHTDDAM